MNKNSNTTQPQQKITTKQGSTNRTGMLNMLGLAGNLEKVAISRDNPILVGIIDLGTFQGA